jgi:hypothetical protein
VAPGGLTPPVTACSLLTAQDKQLAAPGTALLVQAAPAHRAPRDARHDRLIAQAIGLTQ